MKRPPYGLHIPCRVTEVRDGDTIVVSIREPFSWAIRLLDCWCPESRSKDAKEKAAGIAAKAYCQRLVDASQQLSVEIRWPEDLVARIKSGEQINPLRELATFDRIVGIVWIDDGRTLNEAMIAAGHATKAKQKKE